MTLITPASLRYILGLSISSRVLILLIQYILNIIITDHNADAHKNRYHEFLSTNKTIQLMLPRPYRYLYQCVEGLTKWDGQYFLEISIDGYVSEQHLAFLPLYPICISLVKQILFDHGPLNFNHLLPASIINIEEGQIISVTALESYIQAAVVGISLNNFIFFPIATISLFALTKLVKGGKERYAKNVIWWFCFNPASIFFSASYSESLFAALTFSAMFLIEYRSHNYLTTHQEMSTTSKSQFVPLNHLNRLIYIILPPLVPLALASATRSNGLVNVGFIGYQLLLKYIPMVKLNQSFWSVMACISVAFECLQDLLVLIMSSVIAASGYITFQIYSYIKFCIDNTSHRHSINQGKQIWFKPEWCSNKIPHPYGQVQAKFWNVGLFKYYEFKQLPNFLLAVPMSYLVISGALRGSKEIPKLRDGKKQLAYYVHAMVLTLMCSITINVQVITRLLASACPVVYWIVTDMCEQSRSKNRALTAYFLVYFLVGTILHSNFQPWT